MPLIQSWSAADTALCISTIVGYVVTLTLAFLLHKRVNAVQESFNKCTSGIPYIFQRDKTDQEPKPENSTTLIEPPHSQLLFLSLFLLTRSAFIQSQNVFTIGSNGRCFRRALHFTPAAAASQTSGNGTDNVNFNFCIFLKGTGKYDIY